MAEAMQSRRDTNEYVSAALDVTVENNASIAMDSEVSDNTPGTSETPLCTHSAQKLNLLQVFTLPKTDS